MIKYFYCGQGKKEFYLEFIHNVRCNYYFEPNNDSATEEAYGIIVVPKEYDNS